MKTIFPSKFLRWIAAGGALWVSALAFCSPTPPIAAASPTAPSSYSVQVTGQGSPIYLLPGLGCSGAVWSEVVRSLEKTHECHLFTFAGFAGQPPVGGPFLDTMGAALGDYLAAHPSHRPVLVGHSLGGLLALRLAARFPDRPAGLVVVDALPFYGGAQPGATPDSARSMAVMIRTALEQQPHEAFLAGLRQGLPLLVTAEAAQATVFGWMEQSDQATVARAMAEVIGTDAREDVGKITCPILLVEAGAGPGAVPEAVFTQQYPTRALLTRVRVTDARHFVMLDQPARFLSELQTFLQTRP